MYSNRILELFNSPSYAGGLQGANAIGKYVDQACGDTVKLYLKVNDNVITEAKFKTMGSVATIVISSALCSCLLECSLEEALNIDKKRIKEITGEFPEDKQYAFEIVFNALKNAVDDYYARLLKEEKKKKTEENIAPQETYKLNTDSKVLKDSKVAPIVQDRRVSLAKANFDAMFEE